jgi:hypothetical protein
MYKVELIAPKIVRKKRFYVVKVRNEFHGVVLMKKMVLVVTAIAFFAATTAMEQYTNPRKDAGNAYISCNCGKKKGGKKAIASTYRPCDCGKKRINIV